MTRLNRLPIRLRLTLIFTVATALVLAGMGALLYVRMERALNAAIERNLRERAADVSALVRHGGVPLPASDGLTDKGTTFSQVLDGNGAIIDATDGFRSPLITPGEARSTRAGPVFLTSEVRGDDDGAKLLALPVDLDGRRLVVVVGESLETQGDALESLLTQLFIAAPLTLLLFALAAYLLTARALRPVERMRQEAAAVSVLEPGRRLPVPEAKDEMSALGTTLNDMLERLEAALDRERRFVSDASHELRTPLAALRTELDLALVRERTPAELVAALRSAAEETDRLCQLAEDLLVLARAEAGKLPLRRERLPAQPLLEDVRRRYQRRADDAGRTISLNVEHDVEFCGDRLRLEQALGNLLDNALRHGRGDITLTATRRNRHAEIAVHDEGDGFPVTFAGRAFEPFSRADPSRSPSGAGLGLAIVDVIARAHDGSAHVADGTEAGVWIELPNPERSARSSVNMSSAKNG